MINYFICNNDSGFIKIGVTRNIISAVKRIRSKYGPLVLLGLMEGDYMTEKRLQDRFYRHNIQYFENAHLYKRFVYGRDWGYEWFHPVKEIKTYIKENSRYDLLSPLAEVVYDGSAKFAFGVSVNLLSALTDYIPPDLY